MNVFDSRGRFDKIDVAASRNRHPRSFFIRTLTTIDADE
jgi:hypothetical protein